MRTDHREDCARAKWEREWDAAMRRVRGNSRLTELLITGPGGRPHTIEELRSFA